MKKSKKFILLIILISTIFVFTGCTNNDLNFENKIDAELYFSENRILNFLKMIEYKEYENEGNIEWERVKKETDIFVNSFSVIERDFNYAKMEQKQLIDIKNHLNEISNNVENKEINRVINAYSELYMDIMSVKSNSNRDIKKIAMKIYNFSLKEDGTSIKKELSDLKNKLNDLKNDDEFVKVNGFSINKIEDNIRKISEFSENNEYKEIREKILNIMEIM